MAINIDDKFDEARKLVDINLNASIVSDAVLGYDAFKGEAIRFVSSRTSNEDEVATRAAVYALASIIARVVPDIVAQSNAGFSWQKSKTDYLAKADALEQKAFELIDASEAENPSELGEASKTDMSWFSVASRARTSLTELSSTSSFVESGDLFDA